jgi:hypothetical protein
MTGREELPLDSPNWIAVSDAYPATLKHSASSALAITDLQAALESERIRSKARWLPGPPPHSQAMQVLLSGKDWREHYEIRRRDNGIVAVARKGRSLNPFAAFFLWWPDVIKAFPSREPASESQPMPIKASPAAQEKRKRQQQHKWDAIKWEMIRQVAAEAPPPLDNAAEIARRVEVWCEKKGAKPPTNSALRDEVSKIIDALRELI